MDVMSSSQRSREPSAKREVGLLEKGMEMMFSPEKAEAEYIKRKGKPMDPRTELRLLIFSGIIIIIIILSIGFVEFVVTKNPHPSSRAFFFFSVFLLVFIWFLTFNYHMRKKGRVAKPSPLKHSLQFLNVKCPYCNSTFQILQQEKPFKVKCPKCGKESLLR